MSDVDIRTVLQEELNNIAPEVDMAGVDPTYAWSRRLSDGRIGIEAALFCEYEEHVVVLRPAAIRIALARPTMVEQGA